MPNRLKLIISILLPNVIGWLGSVFTLEAIPTWYAQLEKPFFQPPNWLFGPTWIVLYTLMGIACYLVWKEKKSPNQTCALHLYAVQLFLNAIWTPIFFGAQETTIALGIIILLVIFVSFTIVAFYRIRPLAAYLLIPYLLWISFATALNKAIVLLN